MNYRELGRRLLATPDDLATVGREVKP